MPTRLIELVERLPAARVVADVRAQVALSLFTDFESFSTFKPALMHERSVNVMLDQVIAWIEHQVLFAASGR